MWIHVYPNWKTNFDSKNCRKRSFSFESEATNSLITTRGMCLYFPIMKRKEIVMWIHVYPNRKMNFISKNGRKRSFSFESEATKSFIRTRGMHLYCPIMKRKEIIMWIHVYPNWKTNFDSKNGRKRCFTFESKASKSFITTRRTCL